MEFDLHERILSAVDTPIIDCDVHVAAPPVEALHPYLAELAEHWPDYLTWTRFQTPPGVALTYPEWARTLVTSEPRTAHGLREGLNGVSRAIVHCYYGVESLTHPYLAPHLASAVNRWVADEFLAHDDRLLASASITPDLPASAVEEIERISEDRRFVQLLLPARSLEPYGKQRYWPIWEAAARHDLVLGITFGGYSGAPPTPVNWLPGYFENYAVSPVNYQTQIVSLILSGVFDRWPNLRVSIVESGWTWAPAFMWRMDAEWRQFRREVPWVTRPPSSYVRSFFRFTTQPTDAPAKGSLKPILDQLGGDEVDAAELLMYASDYPHRSSPGIDDLRGVLTDEQLERVVSGNACTWYGIHA
jgi:predicted TIM-barrel fold metal-dependent hydrolase